jgi:hypothetical protein
MKENVGTGQDGAAQYYGAMAADTTIPRIECRHVPKRSTVSFGSSGLFG